MALRGRVEHLAGRLPGAAGGRTGLEADGITAHPLAVLVPVTVLGGAAAGFFIAAAARWRMTSRLLLLGAQVPAAYVSAVSLGYTYLCLFGDGCP